MKRYHTTNKGLNTMTRIKIACLTLYAALLLVVFLFAVVKLGATTVLLTAGWELTAWGWIDLAGCVVIIGWVVSLIGLDVRVSAPASLIGLFSKRLP